MIMALEKQFVGSSVVKQASNTINPSACCGLQYGILPAQPALTLFACLWLLRVRPLAHGKIGEGTDNRRLANGGVKKSV